MKNTVLSGRKEIMQCVGRSWSIVSKWIKERGFPARKLDGRWESDADMIAEWRRKQISGD